MDYGRDELANELQLTHSAATLSWVGDNLLVGSLGTQSDCEESGESGCEQEAPRFSVVDTDRNDLRGTFSLPRVDEGSTPELSVVVEWLELVHTPDGAGLLQRRGYSCRSQQACEDNAIPYEWETDYGGQAMNEATMMDDGDDVPDMAAPAEPVATQHAQGQIDEVWLYPIDPWPQSLGVR